MMLELLKRQGYSVVRYQADTVGFTAASRTMTLATTDTAKAAVQRDSTLLVARSILYNDSTKMIAAKGDTIVMRDPARGEDVTGLMEMTYDLARREGRTRDFSTIANSGEDWRVMAHRAAFVSDTTNNQSTVYGRDGLITSCLDSVPHYHFLAKELKRVSSRVIVARPAILYVADVPVMWLPFIFQDIRTGRRSGILTPRAGFSEVVRNSPTRRSRWIGGHAPARPRRTRVGCASTASSATAGWTAFSRGPWRCRRTRSPQGAATPR
jgi:lipopolysaccharide assembly outer membrane protein LptD (OstA)